MANQRRFGLAYRGQCSTTQPVRDRRRRRRTTVRRLAERIRTAVSQLGDESLNPLLDEEFDELACEPGVLLQLVNQA